jgi:hypothetical protein
VSRVLEQYLRSLYDDYASGEAAVEVSGYGALQALLNSVGEELNPRVRIVVNPRNRGAVLPTEDSSHQTSFDTKIMVKETGQRNCRAVVL